MFLSFYYVFLLIGIFLLIIFFYFVNKSPLNFLIFGMYVLAFTPFYLGLDISKLPEIFVDESPFVIYFIYFVFSLYFFTHLKDLNFKNYFYPFVFLSIFIICHSISFFTAKTSYEQIRAFFETYGWSFFIFTFFFVEVNQKNYEKLITNVKIITVILSLYIIFEYIFKYNPVFELMKSLNVNIEKGYLYISPGLAQKAGGVYRPYGTFSIPSTVGTFIALGFPFLFYNFNAKSVYSAIIALIAIIFNYTRGVWVALATVSILYLKKLRKLFPFFIIIGVISLYLLYVFLPENPFVKRLFDPSNLMARFVYWKIAFLILKEKLLFGIGHGNFKEVYLQYVDYINLYSFLDIHEVTVADNMYLNTLVEHGIIGFLSLIMFISYIFIRFYRYCRKEKDSKKVEFIKYVSMAFSIFLVAGFFADVNLFPKCMKYLFILLGSAFGVIKEEEV